MKNYLMKIFLLFVLSVVFQNYNPSKSFASHYFDSYQSDAPWQEQKAHLDNFAFYLKKNPEMIGYIAFFTKENQSVKKPSLALIVQ